MIRERLHFNCFNLFWAICLRYGLWIVHILRNHQGGGLRYGLCSTTVQKFSEFSIIYKQIFLKSYCFQTIFGPDILISYPAFMHKIAYKSIFDRKRT